MTAATQLSKDMICQVFIDSIHHFFIDQSNIAANVNLPYIINSSDQIVDDLSACIRISGSKSGFVYVFGPEGLFSKLIETLIGASYITAQRVKDLAGDLANTISGNARYVFGSDFVISVPKISDRSEGVTLPLVRPTIAIPVQWQGYMLKVVIGLE